MLDLSTTLMNTSSQMKYVYFRGLSSELSSDETLKIIEDWSQTASVPSLNSIIL